MSLRDGSTQYEIEIVQPRDAEHGVATVHLDGKALRDGLIPRLRDGGTHRVSVVMRAPAARAG